MPRPRTMAFVRTRGATTVAAGATTVVIADTVGMAVAGATTVAVAVAAGVASTVVATGVVTGAVSAEAGMMPEIREIARDATREEPRSHPGYAFVVLECFTDAPTTSLPFPVCRVVTMTPTAANSRSRIFRLTNCLLPITEIGAVIGSLKYGMGATYH